MTLREQHKLYIKKYKEIWFPNWYTKHKKWMSDEQIFNFVRKVPNNHKCNPNSMHQQWIRWKKETGETKCYEWYKRKIKKWESLDEYTITITEQWNKEWNPWCYSTYWQNHSPIIMNRVTGKEVKDEPIENKKEEVKKLDLKNVDIAGDNYYLTLA